MDDEGGTLSYYRYEAVFDIPLYPSYETFEGLEQWEARGFPIPKRQTGNPAPCRVLEGIKRRGREKDEDGNPHSAVC